MIRSAIDKSRCMSVIRSSAIALILGVGCCNVSSAATALADAPLGTASSTLSAAPNLLFTLDDSGSMGWDYLPDYVNKDNSLCKTTKQCKQGHPPFNASGFNGMAYKPGTNYLPPILADKMSTLPSQTCANTGGTGSCWTKVDVDGYGIQSTATINMTTGYQDYKYCSGSGACKINGVDTNNPFAYRTDSSTDTAPDYAFPASMGGTSYTTETSYNTHPYYYVIIPVEYCDDLTLTNCVKSTVPTTVASINYNYPAPVRYCSSAAIADLAPGDVGAQKSVTGALRCQGKYNASSFNNPRFGLFYRVDIVSTTTSYGDVTLNGTYNIAGTTVSFSNVKIIDRSGRADCAAAPNCTYAEEMTNFSNWYAYYHTRMQMMKSSAGYAFASVDSNYRVGFITINPGSPVTGYAPANTTPGTKGKFLPVATFDVTQRGKWYDIFYDQKPNNSTPLREAVSRAGRYFAGKRDQLNSGMISNSEINASGQTYYLDDPVQYSCQQNFLLLTTDGYWNGTSGYEMNGTTTMGNYDGVDGGLTARSPYGVYDGSVSSSTTKVTTSVLDPGTTAMNKCGSAPSVCYSGGTVTVHLAKNHGMSTGDTVAVTAGTTGSSVPTSCIKDSTSKKYTWCMFDHDTGANGGCTNMGSHAWACRQSSNGNACQTDTSNNNWCVYTSNSASGTSSCTKLATGAYSCKVNAAPAPCGTAYLTSSVSVTVIDPTTFTYTATGSTTTGTNCKITATITTTTVSTGTSTANTLADAAVYYYLNDLRTSPSLGALGSDVSLDNVPPSSADPLTTQHMRTFTLGLADGLMTYQPDYQTATTGDFASIVSGAKGCSFSGGGTNVCNWPAPAADSPTALDDLWHAAVNGRGAYYNARDPESLSEGIYGALSGMKQTIGAAAASSTSSPNVTQTNNDIFSSTYQTSSWDGEVYAEKLDPATGQPITSYTTTDPVTGATIVTHYLWTAQAQLDQKVTSSTTASILERNIFTIDTTGAQVQFLYNNLGSSQKAYFTNKGSLLTQYSALSAANKALADSGDNLVNYLRGQWSLESGPVYRPRAHHLGDTVNATPAYMKAPTLLYEDAVTPLYKDFQATNASRQAMLYIGANDGMLHAFNADTGAELWAYVPRMVMPNLYQLADTHYATNHRYFVDGSPLVTDIYSGGAWHTILVAGLNKGGKGYYALDVTDPGNPVALWETCNDSTLCLNSDANLGYSYGNPVVTKRAIDGKWVVLVTSGYNNDTGTGATGQGYLFELDAMTGAVLRKVSTGSGTTTSPSGLAKIGAWVDLMRDNTVRIVYAGDLNGDVWRFDLGAVGATASPITAAKIAHLADSSGNAQPITTAPELSEGSTVAGLGMVDSLAATGKPLLFFGTGRFLGGADPADTSVQSLYAIKDDLALSSATLLANNVRSKMVQQSMVLTTDPNGAPIRSTMGGSTVDWTVKSGWFIDFNLSAGERVNIDPVLIMGTLVVATNVPNTDSTTACYPGGGSAYLYSIDYASGKGTGRVVANALGVGFVVVRLPSGQIKAILTDSQGHKTVVSVTTQGNAPTRRASWRELMVQ